MDNLLEIKNKQEQEREKQRGKQKSALEKAIRKIKKAGFTHLKLELEANLGRCYRDSYYEDCIECGGRGYIFTEDEEGNETEIECEYCCGEGNFEQERDSWNESQCHDYIMEYLVRHDLAETTDDGVTLGHTGITSYYRPLSPLKYVEFYEDGSVDSEITFTVEIDRVDVCMTMFDALESLADEIGNGIETNGAGMHITLLTSGRYPVRGCLPEANIQNFRGQVQKLLPALFVAAMATESTREYRFRMPQVSRSDKYSAIYTHGDTCLEYRLFETCYERPEALYEFLGTIAKTLEYYINPDKLVHSIGETYEFHGDGCKLANTPEQVKVLKRQMKFVRPQGYSIKQITDVRGIELSATAINKRMAEQISETKRAYKRYCEWWDERYNSKIDDRIKARIDYYIANGYDEDDATLRAKGLGPKQLESDYIKENTSHYTSARITV